MSPNATRANTTVSKNSPTNVEPISRSHSFSPFVLTFNFANTNEFRNEPVKNAAKLAATILGKNPRTARTTPERYILGLAACSAQP